MSAATNFDYALLLTKYMRHVLDCEGVTFMDHSPESDSSAELSKAEWAELERIAEKARNR